MLGSILAVAAVAVYLRPIVALPPGFEDEAVAQIRQPVDIAFTPDNKLLFAATKEGLLYTFNLETEETDIAIDMSGFLCVNGERGLGTVAIHPNFEETRWIYLFYTYNKRNDACPLDERKGPVNRCSRFTVHNGGDMEFGVDGMLYITLGDGGQRTDAWSQDRSRLYGNILRLTDTGGIPSDNPYTGRGTARCAEDGKIPRGSTATICQEIFAYGLRNPYRFTMDPHSTRKVRYLISDVGGKSWEEINVGGTDYAGKNYGWPEREGPCQYNRMSNCPPNREMEDPIYWYPHDKDGEGCVLGVAIPPASNLNWPSHYSDPDSFFYVDFVYGKIFHVSPDDSNLCRTCNRPRHGYDVETFHRWEKPVGLQFGPYKGNQLALYYTSRNGAVGIRRIVYKGGDNYAPTARFVADKVSIPANGIIEFDASSTSDRNHPNAELTFRWDFGDGSSVETGIVVSHRYRSIGVYEVTMTVRDPDGARAVTKEEVSVGGKPTVRILAPGAGAKFAVGDVFTLVGTGADSLGNTLDSTNLSWEVRQHHADHYHPFLDPTEGNNIVITEAPEPEDFFAATNSYLEILLTGTAPNGLTSTVSRRIMPKEVFLDFDSNPTGLTLILDDESITMPARVLSWENHRLRVNAPDQGSYIFLNWANGVANRQRDSIVVPADGADETYVANFAPSSSGGKGTTSLPVELSVKGNNLIPASAFPLQKCEGDCDRDSDCASGLSCFNRGNGDVLTVPGCLGEASGTVDYCYESDVKNLEVLGNNGEPPEAFPLGQCQGDCDRDSDCEGNLVCLQRGPEDSEEVPGCGGRASGGQDYCYAPPLSRLE